MKRQEQNGADNRAGAASGQMMIVFALTLVVFVGALLLGVDLSHLRAEAENAQRTANAAALAGAVFMPDYQAQAFYRAKDEATKNGFADGARGVSIVPAAVPGYAYRLQVTVSEPVPLFFGHLFGLGAQHISRTATAEYLPPIQMGSPDYVLGYAPFATTVVTGTVPENFYLNSSGPYDIKENGEPYSPIFESYNNGYSDPFGDGSPHHAAGCTPAPTCNAQPAGGGGNLTTNARHTAFSGYNYVVDDPVTNTLLIKLFDPYYESDYNASAKLYASRNAPENQAAPAVIGSGLTKMIDGVVPTVNQFGSYGTSLDVSLAGPYKNPYDPRTLPITAAAPSTGPITATQCSTQATNCVLRVPNSLDPGFTFGGDPTVCTNSSCSASNYAYRFVNYAVIHGPGIFKINVQAVQNQEPGNTHYGTIHNSYGVAVCDASTDPSYTGGTPLALDASNNPLGTDTANPVASGGGWNATSCASPNSSVAACASPRFAPPHTCVHLYADGKMPVYNLLNAGTLTAVKSLIPLGYIPPDYAGKKLKIDLFDPGDIDQGTSATGCPTGQVNCLEVLTPAGDLTYFDNKSPANDPNGGAPFLPNLPYKWYAGPDLSATNYGSQGSITNTTQVANGTAFDVGTSSPWNGSWVHLQMDIPANYADMVTQYGGYWKMFYRIGGNAHDATTWQMSVAGSAVHLVTPPA